LRQAAEQFGYRSSVFNSFEQWLDDTLRPDYPWAPDTAFTILKQIFIPKADDGSHKLYMLLPDNPYVGGLMEQNARNYVTITSPSILAAQIAAAVRKEFSHLGWAALIAVMVCVIVLYRNLPVALLVISPMLAGTAAVLLYAALQAAPLKLFAIAALPLLLGLSIDYGIFMVYGCRRNSCAQSRQAVFLSSLTTLAGFGSLILASHPALNSLGIIVSIGILGAVPMAMAIPWLVNNKKP
jgi:predicted RND superfamily exporter protein